MSSKPMKRKSPVITVGYPCWMPLICRSSGVSRPISHVDPLVWHHHRARIAIALTLALLLVTTNTLAESHAQSSSMSRIETPSVSSLDILGMDRRSRSAVFLPASEAFTVKVRAVTAESITVDWTIADGYYLYRDKFQFAMKEAVDQQMMGAAHLPAGQRKDDLSFGQVEVFYHFVQAVIPWRWDASNTSDITLDIEYQGCADQGLCYPPATTTLIIERPDSD